MTGISDIVCHTKSIRRSMLFHFLKLFRNHSFLKVFIDHWIPIPDDGIDSMPKPRIGHFQENANACNPFARSTKILRESNNTTPSLVKWENLVMDNKVPCVSPRRWGILLPICCRDQTGDDCWRRLEELVYTIEETVSFADRNDLMIFLGIDHYDHFLMIPKRK